MQALSKGKIVGYQGNKIPPRPIYEFTYNGEVRRIAVEISNNGYIVSANMRSIGEGL
jgi:hypothetical protein